MLTTMVLYGVLLPATVPAVLFVVGIVNFKYE